MKFKHFFSFMMIASILLWGVSCDESTSSNEGIPETTNVLVLSNYVGANEWIDTTFTKYIPGLEITTQYVDYTLSKQEGNMVSPEYMAMFDVVFVFEDGLFDNAAGIGDSLYAYVMDGGNLVMATFLWQDHTGEQWNSTLGENFESIIPIMGGSCAYQDDSLGVVNNHLLTTNLDQLYGYYRGGPDSLRSNATAVAWWSDGSILIGYNKPNGTITAVTMYPGEPYVDGTEVTENFLQLWANALFWTAWGETAGLAPKIVLPAIDKPASGKMVNNPGTGKSGTGANLNR